MFCTTLRISDDLAAHLQEAAKAQSLSVNAFLARLILEHREAERRGALAREWAAYAADAEAQDVDYAVEPQSELAAEPEAPFQRSAPGLRRSKG